MAMVSHGAHEIFTEGLRHQELGWVRRRARADNPVWLAGSLAAVRPNDAGHARKRTRSRAFAQRVVMMRGDDDVERRDSQREAKREPQG